MFNKKTCSKCGEKVSKKFEFCPSCGKPLKEQRQEDWGMLGKNDLEEIQTNPFGGLGGGMLNKMLGNAMKMLEKEMQKGIQNQEPQQGKTNFELFINGKRISPDKIKVTQKQIPIKQPNKPRQNKSFEVEQSFSKEKAQKFAKLEQREPPTNIRRFSNKIVYEITMPEVKSIEDISVIQLENSIEVKAIGKNKAYIKTIPITLPLVNKEFHKGMLTLELDAQE
jgi:hypothetical protein